MKNLRDTYKLYKKDCKENKLDRSDILDIKSYLELQYLFIKYLMKRVIVDGDIISLPHRLGTLSIIGLRFKISFDENNNVKGLSPNWKKTKELHDRCPECKEKNQIIYNTNEHSDGIRYKFFWGRAGIMLQNKNFYTLKMSRENKRFLWKTILGGKEYIHIEKE